MRSQTLQRINEDEIRRRATKALGTRLVVVMILVAPVGVAVYYIAGEVCMTLFALVASAFMAALMVPLFADVVSPGGD